MYLATMVGQEYDERSEWNDEEENLSSILALQYGSENTEKLPLEKQRKFSLREKL